MDEIEIRIHDEICDYKEKFKGLSFRQWMSIILVAILALPTYFLSREYIGEEIAEWIVIFIAAPIALFGFIPIQGLPAEKIAPFVWRYYMKFAKTLPYKTEIQLEQEHLEKLQQLQAKKDKHAIYRFYSNAKTKIKEKIRR